MVSGLGAGLSLAGPRTAASLFLPVMEGAGAPSETLRYAEYARVPGGGRQGEPDMDRGLARTMMAVGLGVAAVAFAGRYAFQVWKPLEQVFTETAKKIATAISCAFIHCVRANSYLNF
uniref:Uncharacterized protein n=1 Tax=Gopherus agassizii TaxID=38772 RepID=A0A452I558_9SAUR